MDKLKMQTANKADENFKKLAAMFPNAVTETIDENGEVVRAIDKDVLMQEISCKVVDGNEERYQFTWPDKKKSVLLANAPINKTLRPCREESVDFDNTENLYIEGDNLEVLKLLQETYLGKVKMIYIDPPYNTGKDFIYNDKFNQPQDEYVESSGQYDEDGHQLVQNVESNGRFHTDWLNMLYPRIKLSKDLLTDDGVIFISIDNRESANLRKVCNDVFGESCFVTDAIWRSSDNSNNDAKQFSNDYNSTLVYSKKPLWQPKKQMDGDKRTHFKNPDNDPKGAYFDGNPLNSPNYRENLIYDIVSPQGFVIHPPKNGWRWSKETLQEKMSTGEIRFTPDGKGIRRRTYLVDMKGLPPSNLWIDLDRTGHNRQAKYELLNLLPENVFDTPKPVKLLTYILGLIENDENIIVLDYFSGSSTTADAVMQQNVLDGCKRKYIMVQLPENLDESLLKASNDKKQILKKAISLCDKMGKPHLLTEVAKERIRRAAKKIAEENPEAKFDGGFRVLKCDSSNMKEVYYNLAEYEPSLFSLLEDNIKEDRTPEDLLFQVMLDLGVLLSSKIEETTIAGKKVFNVEDNYLIACFDENVTEEVITEIAKQKPYYFVMRDRSMANDSVATNFEQIFAAYSHDTVRKVL
jgi:adenine-specific DNA-methyltransferase